MPGWTSHHSRAEYGAPTLQARVYIHKLDQLSVEDGRLVLPFGTGHGVPVTCYLVYPSDGDMTDTAAEFVDFAACIAEA